jgi:hypothetical protein
MHHLELFDSFFRNTRVEHLHRLQFGQLIQDIDVGDPGIEEI